MSGLSVSLKNAVATGACEPTSVRLWLRTTRPGAHTVELSSELDTREVVIDVPANVERDGTHTFVIPDDVEGAMPLRAGSTYHYTIMRADGVALGHGRFKTPAIDPPERYAIGVASCHQPFGEDGRPSARAAGLIEEAEVLLDQRHVEALLLCGDQMYVDAPAEYSLFDDAFFKRAGPASRSSILECDAGEVRHLLHRRYRSFWASEPFQRLQARYASYPMVDDHELVDNFGSAEAHATEEWAAFRKGALDAAHDYQTSRVLGHDGTRPKTLHYEFRRGDIATFVMDLRSARRVKDDGALEILGAEQMADLERFLFEDHADAHVIALVATVPLVHMPEMMTAIGVELLGDGSDIHDRWSQPAARDARDALMRLIYAHRKQRPWQGLVVLGGDVHVGTVTEVTWDDDETPGFFQLASSPLTNDEAAVFKRLSGLAFQTTSTIEGCDDVPDATVRMLPGVGTMDMNPVPALNIGVVAIERHGARSRFRLELIAMTDEGARTVYQSAALPGPLGCGPGAESGELLDLSE